MVADALHGAFHVGEVERLVHGMLRVASHPELLPYHDAQFVAQLVEAVALGNAASPQAQQVDAALVGVGQLGFHAAVVGAEHRLGNPVGAAHEGLVTVHQEELRLVGRLAGGNDFADAEARREAVHHVTLAVGQRQAKGIEVLFALILRPPKARVLDDELRIVLRREGDCRVFAALQLQLRGAESDRPPVPLYGEPFDAAAHGAFAAADIGVPDFHTDGLGSGVVVRMSKLRGDIWTAQLLGASGIEPNRTPDACVAVTNTIHESKVPTNGHEVCNILAYPAVAAIVPLVTGTPVL